MKCDVLVLGGGAAGLAAAITAARAGAQTVLLERGEMLGGMATLALVHTVCGLYRLRDEPGAVYAHVGFPVEFAERLLAAGAATPPVRMGRLDVLPHDPEGFAKVTEEIARATPGLQVRLGAELRAAHGSGGVEQVTFFHGGSAETIEPRTVVDASGDAALAAALGAAWDQAPAERLQRAAYIAELSRVSPEALGQDGRLRLAAAMALAVQRGELPDAALGAHMRLGAHHRVAFLTIDLRGEENFDPTDAAQVAQLERVGREAATAIADWLQTRGDGFAEVQIAAHPTRLGVRESRRIVGRATVCADDVLLGTPHTDCVALGVWPMENRERHTGPRWRFPEANRATQIPLGALQARDAANLWMAGRCLSCDHEAQAALRVIGVCLATGQAAGAAAALQAQSGAEPTAAAVRALIEKTCHGEPVEHR